MSIKESQVLLKKETVKVQEVNVTIQKLLDTFISSMTEVLDKYYISEEEPEMGVDNYSDSVEVTLSVEKVKVDNVATDVNDLFEDRLNILIESESSKSEEPEEEGENGQL